MKQFVRAWCGLIGIVAVACGSGSIVPTAEADPIGPPDRLAIGRYAVVLNGTGIRNVGPLDVYGASLYLGRRTSEPAHIFHQAMPSAMRFEILATPVAMELPPALRESVRKILSPAQFEQISAVYQGLKVGDILVFAYTPETGTTVALNGTTALSIEGHSLTRAIFDEWLSPETNTQRLRSQLLNAAGSGTPVDTSEIEIEY